MHQPRKELSWRCVLLGVAFTLSIAAPPAAAEMFRWVDAQGRVHYSDQPQAGAKTVELEDSIQVTKPVDPESAGPSEAVLRARQKRREIQRWADREARKHKRSTPLGPIGERQRYAPSLNGRDVPLGKSPARIKEERCQRRYGKSCSELEQQRAKARTDCERRQSSRDCERPEALAKQRPRTLDEQAEIAAKRAKRSARRERRSERAIEALGRRGQQP